MLSSWLVSWRNVTRHKKRFIFTLIAIILGVTVMTSMLIAKYTFSNLMEEQETLYAGEADFLIQSNEGYFQENELDWLKNQGEIDASVTSLLKRGFVEMETNSLAQRSVRFTGISSFHNEIVKLPVKEGDVTKEGLIITENAANLWNKGVGDTVTFNNIGTIEITAIVYEGAMLNSPKTMEDALFRDFRVMVPLDLLQKRTGLENQVSNYRFSVIEGLNHQELLASYQSRLEGTNLFVQPVVVDSRQNNDVESIYYVFDLIAILAVFISAFIAFNTIHTSIVERKKEIGIMKSLGYTAGKVVRLILREIGTLAVIGTIIGLGLGTWLGFIVQHIFIIAIATQDITYDFVLVEPLIVSTIVGILFPFVAATLPLIKAGKTPVLEAMFKKSITSSQFNNISKFRIIIGVIFTGIGLIDNVWAFLLLFVGLVLLYPLWIRLMQVLLRPVLSVLFGFSGKQALQSIKQFERRNANTIAMLAIGISLALFMGAAIKALPDGMEEEIRATYGGDIHILKEIPWSDSDLEALQIVTGIEYVHPFLEVPNVTWYSKDQELREFSIISFSTESPTIFVKKEETNDSSDYPSIYVGERALIEWGGEVGEVLTLHTPAGKQSFFVKGSVQSSHYSNYVAFVEEQVIQETLNWPWSYQLMIDVTEKEDIPHVIEEIWNQFGESIAGVSTISTTIEKTTSVVKGMDELMHGLLLLVIGISAIGISNTLFMNTMERVKEIGTMRAIGFTKGQVRLMILAEGIFIGISGVVVGTIYGILVIYLNSISTQAQGMLDFIVPWISLVLAIAGGILFTLFASWLPSNSATRVSIKEAIQYE